jgi:hypothetical protein
MVQKKTMLIARNAFCILYIPLGHFNHLAQPEFAPHREQGHLLWETMWQLEMSLPGLETRNMGKEYPSL